MNDAEFDFDGWLATELAPPEREADGAFVAATMQFVAEREAFVTVRRRLLADAVVQAAALGALVVGLVMLSRVPALAQFGQLRPGLLAPPLILVLLLWGVCLWPVRAAARFA